VPDIAQSPAAVLRVTNSSGRWLRVAGVCLVLLGTVALTPLENNNGQPNQDLSTIVIFGLPSLACVFGGLYCFIRGRKLKAISAQALVAADQRPPVVYLRSFKDDAAAASNPFQNVLGVATFIFGMSTEEEQLAEAFSGIGPFIAIGKPGEKLPQVGAARMYVGNEEWHDCISGWMASAQLVVLRAGRTDGFWWEVKRAGEVVGPARILFLVPFGRKRYEEFRERAETLLPCRLPRLPRGRSFSLGRLRAIICFAPDWTPQIVRLKARLSLSLNPLAPVLRKALEPIARGLKVDVRPAPHRGRFIRALATIPGVVAAAFVCSLVAGFAIALLNNVGVGDYEKGNLNAAIAKYREAIRLNPGFAEAHSNLCLALSDKGNTDEAIAECRQAIRLKPNLAEAHTNLGFLIYQKGDADEAITEYRDAIRLKPDLAEAHSNLCLALSDKGNADEAIAECRQAIRLKPNLLEAHSNLGISFYRKGDLDGAITEYREAIRLKPELADAHGNLCLALSGKGNADEAIAECRDAIRLKPNVPETHSSLCFSLYQKGDLDRAIAEGREAIRLEPDLAEAHSNLCLALSGKGNADEAIAECRHAIRLKPDSFDAHNSLGLALYHKHDLDAAAVEYREALRLNPRASATHSSLCLALCDKGKPDEGIAECREAIRLDPRNAMAQSNLGIGLAQKGDRAALDEFHKAYQLTPDDPTIRANHEWALKHSSK
jgi:tetratricopeptide (TPR) repeat protein